MSDSQMEETTVSRPFSVAVYCSSSKEVAPVYFEAAEALGREIAARDWRLVYGGGGIGLMGALARAVHAHHGKIYGVIPHALDRLEVTYEQCDELIRVETMRERKALMEENADAFIALPGGIGTLEEIVEILVLKQLGYLDRPILFLNINGFWAPLIALFDEMLRQRFMAKAPVGANSENLYKMVDTPPQAIDYIMHHYQERGGGKKRPEEQDLRTALE